MKKLLDILTLLLVLSLLYAHSCSEENNIAQNEDDLLTKSRDSIRAEFEKDSVSNKTIFAFEAASIQKLSDFADYLNIVADTSIDLPFRQKTGEMISKIFVSANVDFELILKPDKTEKKYSIGQLTQSALENRLENTQFRFDSIRIGESFHKNSPVSYSATLWFTQKIKTIQSSDFHKMPHEKEVDVFVEKQDKIFGDDTLKVWKVRLGEIR